jgi:hypothetical protein
MSSFIIAIDTTKTPFTQLRWYGWKYRTPCSLFLAGEMAEGLTLKSWTHSEFQFNPAIRETINEIIEHLEAGRDFPFQSCWAGSLAAERWESLFDGREAA